MDRGALFTFTVVTLLLHGVHPTTFTVRNNCPYTIWPGLLTGQVSPPSSTGFQLDPQASSDVTIQAPWSGRIWARFECTNNTGSFTCLSADCGSGQIPCNGNGPVPPASLVEFTTASGFGTDFYDISLVDGFNLPVTVATQGGSGCGTAGCPVDINANAKCPSGLAVKDKSGGTIGCKSACLAFDQPQYCCTGAFGTPATCKPTNYSEFFKGLCLQAYSYAFDDPTSTFT
ncbi:hypothetical protein NMG60_11000651 [Bertholletia excelsa]